METGCLRPACSPPGPWPSLQEADVEAGGGCGAGLKVTVFAQFTETQILPDFPPGWGSAVPLQSTTVRSRVGAVEMDPGMRRGGIRDVAHPCGKVSAEQLAGSGIPIGERSSTPRRHRPVRRRRLAVPAGFRACRPRMNVPATGIIHAGPGSLLRRGGEATNRNASSRTAARTGVASVGAASCRPAPKTGARRRVHR